MLESVPRRRKTGSRDNILNTCKTPALNNEDGLQQMITQYRSILAEYQFGQKCTPGSKS